MKRIVFVSANRRLIEKMSAMLSSRLDINCSLLSTSRIYSAVEDIKEFATDLVILDMLSVEQKCEMLKLYQKLFEDNIVRECVCLIRDEQTRKIIEYADSSVDKTIKIIECDEKLEQLLTYLKEE